MGSLRTLKKMGNKDNQKELLREEQLNLIVWEDEEEQVDIALLVCRDCRVGIHCTMSGPFGTGGWCEKQREELAHQAELRGYRWDH
jgi:hypothetical protein